MSAQDPERLSLDWGLAAVERVAEQGRGIQCIARYASFSGTVLLSCPFGPRETDRRSSR